MKRIFALLTLSLVCNLFAEPRQWTEEGVAVSVAQLIEDASSATNESGFTLSVWAGSQGGVSVVLGQMLSPVGETLWESNGRLLAAGVERAGYPDVIAVDDGWIVGWLDAEFIEWCDGPVLDGSWCLDAAVRAIKLNNDGAPMWGNGRSGVEIVPMRSWADIHPFKMHKSSGGAIFTWGQTFEHEQLNARGVSANGDVWAAPVIASSDLYGMRLEVISDLQGGVLVSWSRAYSHDRLIHANRLLASGELAWADAEGRVILDAQDTLGGFQIAADGAGGMYLAWSTGGFSDEQWVQRFDGNGEQVWADPVRPNLGNGSSGIIDVATSLNNDQNDGVLVHLYWRGQRVQKISQDGSRLWGFWGTPLCDSLENQQGLSQSAVISDRLGGGIMCGMHEVYDENFEYDHNEVRIARVAVDGNPAWGDECVIVGNANGYYPDLKSPMLSDGTVKLTWFEQTSEQSLFARIISVASGEPIGTSSTPVFSFATRTIQDYNAVTLPDGSSALIWRQYGNPSSSARFQILNVFGEPVLNAEGAPLIQLENDSLPSSLAVTACEDGSGGFFGFVTIETATNVEVRGVHISSTGEYLSNAEGTVVLSGAVNNGSAPMFAISDGDGGSYVCSPLYNQQFGSVIAVMRVTASCDPLWTNAFSIDADTLSIYPNGLTLGLDHACILTYSSDTDYPTYVIRSVLVNSNGAQEWSTTLTDSANYATSQVMVCSNRFGGAYIGWIEVTDGATNLTVQNVDTDGDVLWGNGGVSVCPTRSNEVNPSGATDGLGNLTISWSVGEWVNSNLLAQRLTPNGQIQWQENGIIISDALYDQFHSDVVVLSDNEVYVVWQDARDNPFFWTGSRTYATHLNAHGEISGDSWWQAGGNPVAPNGYSQTLPIVINDGVGGAMVAWLDQRAGFGYGNHSLFTQRLYDPIFTDANEKPILPAEFLLSQNYPNPFNPETVIEFALPSAGQTKLKVFDITGREVETLVDEQLTAGNHRVNFDGSRLASGVYFYSLRTTSQSLTRKMVLLK